MGFNRRTFLHQTGALLILGASQTELTKGQRAWAALRDRYLETLAQPSARKLALLVGINNYANGINLSGCVTDVELQRELLLKRFGFQPQDVLTLSGAQATRETIESAFIEHLTEQAGADDIVVFHFSGYGSKVKMPSTAPPQSGRLVNSLMPSDGFSSSGHVNGLVEETLLRLAQTLATKRFTLVLDTSYRSTDSRLQGNLRVRSYPDQEVYPLAPPALEFQEQLRQRYSHSRSKPSRGLTFPGIVLSAVSEDQVATEAMWHGFSAGLFTYALTQSLWQATPSSTVTVNLRQTAEQVKSVVEQQQPQLKAQSPFLTYYQPPQIGVGAEGVITAVDEPTTAQLLLAGLPIKILENYGVNSCLTLPLETSTPATPPPLLQIRSREGLKAKARWLGSPNYSLQVGQLVQEWIRLVPRNLGLTVALAQNLERIERVDATSAFANIDVVSSVVTAGEQPADCLLGKAIAPDPTEDIASTEPKPSPSYQLFSVSGGAMTNANGESEAVKSAVRRLVPALKTLLAVKLWQLTSNEGSSRLRVKATLTTGSSQVLMERLTRRSLPQGTLTLNSAAPVSLPSPLIPTISSGTQIQYRLTNQEERPVYLMLLGRDSGGTAIALYPRSESPDSGSLINYRIAPGETLVIPPPNSASWTVAAPPGLAEIQLIFSQAPFPNTLKALSARQPFKGEEVLDLPNALEVARALLEDLHSASQVSAELGGAREDSYALDVNAWAGLNFIYQVV